MILNTVASGSSRYFAFSELETMPIKKSWIFLSFVMLGVIVRIVFILAADARQLTFHSGGSDAPVYALLAENLVSRKGFTYAGQPSAFRPPAYPILLAGSMEIFRPHYISAIRWLQFFVGLLTVWICGKISSHLFDSSAERATIIFGLFLPTLIFSTDQLLTECLAAFLTALFLLFLVDQRQRAGTASAVGLGFVSGLAALIRFNAAALPLFAAWVVFKTRHRRSFPLRFAAVVLLPCVVIAPWLVRNAYAFPGHILYSTHGGANAVQGVVTTQGRTQMGDSERLLAAMGWTLRDLETNDPARLALPSEVELNRNAIRVLPRLWKEQGWNAVPLLLRKIADFWLSADQILDTKSLPTRERVLRGMGVVIYLLILSLAVRGLYRMSQTRPEIASIFLVYVVGYTLLHLPLVMNTRLRIPLAEPLIIVLAGAGWTSLPYVAGLLREASEALSSADFPDSVSER